MAEKLGADIEDIAQPGPGLAFITYPQAVAMMPLPQLWSCTQSTGEDLGLRAVEDRQGRFEEILPNGGCELTQCCGSAFAKTF
ncbi:hypothetical protein KOW79_015537 [Hemibagrus wyckioides]|uniref:Uncharacterized protein n=1 Tax=Hemibagrus wyckioides TaxID=337641 RepID=A0A9D3NHY4_9TELE|nr:hypothetical protein KOW79_015537 [Hemibagrus wyckioides]